MPGPKFATSYVSGSPLWSDTVSSLESVSGLSSGVRLSIDIVVARGVLPVSVLHARLTAEACTSPRPPPPLLVGGPEIGYTFGVMLD